jgi:putative endonuclease
VGFEAGDPAVDVFGIPHPQKARVSRCTGFFLLIILKNCSSTDRKAKIQPFLPNLFPDDVVRLARCFAWARSLPEGTRGVLPMQGWVVYMIECTDGSIYTGVTSDLEQRWAEHCGPAGSKYTGSHPPFKLLWSERHVTRFFAEKRESQIKRWTRRKKLALVSGDLELLKRL